MTDELGTRLREVRRGRGLSLREFSQMLADSVGYRVSHESVRMYEEVSRVIPSRYLSAVCRACGVSANWLLLGVGSPLLGESSIELPDEPAEAALVAAEMAAQVRAEWDAFFASVGPLQRGSPLFEQARRRGGEPLAPEAAPPVNGELERRRNENHRLLEAAKPLLRTAANLLPDTEHALALYDADGVILWSTASSAALLRRWFLRPGIDWSEEASWRNAVNAALLERRPVACFGTEHHTPPHGLCGRLAAPIEEGARVVGGVEGVALLPDFRPHRFWTLTWVASAIERELES